MTRATVRTAGGFASTVRLLAATGILMSMLAVPAHAATPCTANGGTDLQTAMNVNAATVTIDPGICQPAAALTLGSGGAATVQGSPAGTTIDGSALADSERILTITDAGTPTIRDLTFRDAASTATGGAIAATGDSSPTFDRLQFYGNTGTNGGAMSLSPDPGTAPILIRDSVFGSATPGKGNSASSSGGGIDMFGDRPIEVLRSRFIGNSAAAGSGGGASIGPFGRGTVAQSTFSGNDASQGGGGLFLLSGPGSSIDGSSFTGNTVSGASPPFEQAGAGASAIGQNGSATLAQSGNVFDGNTLSHGGTSTEEAKGAGETVRFASFTSRGDRFTNNRLEVPGSPADAEGAGLALEGCDASGGSHRVESAVVAGNSFTGGGSGGREGGGLYVGCGVGAAALSVFDSTIAGNASGGGVAGLSGGADDSLTMQNSIAAGNSGGADLSGFASKTVSFSDACPLLGGAGNLCANPLLVNAAGGDVHQTVGSPTLDKGSSALVPAGLTTDFEGQARVQGAAVDIGADESVFASADTIAPGVSAASIGKTFAVAKASTPVNGQAAAKRKRKKARRGTTIKYTLSEAATVRLTIERKLKGRRVKKGKKRVCAKPTRKNRKKRKCTRYKRAGKTLVRTSKAGKNKVKFSGRIAKKALKRGSYRLTIIATDSAGNKSKARRLKFRIVKP